MNQTPQGFHSSESKALSTVTSTMQQDDPRPLVLLVEDEDGVRRSLQLLLAGKGYRVKAFSAAEAAIADPASSDAAILIADYRLRDSDGVRLLTALRQRGWHGRAILVTGFGSKQIDLAAHAAGYEAVIAKPMRHQELLAALRLPTT